MSELYLRSVKLFYLPTLLKSRINGKIEKIIGEEGPKEFFIVSLELLKLNIRYL